jgi:type IV secretory pathway VirB2 component (pilin)
MDGLFRFMGSSNGRIARIVAGLVLVLVGFLWVHGAGGWILAIVGLVPLLAGAFDKCVFAPLFGYPFDGSALRKKVE